MPRLTKQEINALKKKVLASPRLTPTEEERFNWAKQFSPLKDEPQMMSYQMMQDYKKQEMMKKPIMKNNQEKVKKPKKILRPLTKKKQEFIGGKTGNILNRDIMLFLVKTMGFFMK